MGISNGKIPLFPPTSHPLRYRSQVDGSGRHLVTDARLGAPTPGFLTGPCRHPSSLASPRASESMDLSGLGSQRARGDQPWDPRSGESFLHQEVLGRTQVGSGPTAAHREKGTVQEWGQSCPK